MRRGELYRVYKGSPQDPKKYRVFVLVSRHVSLDSRFSTAIWAPVYTTFDGLSTQVPVGPDDGLKHTSSTHCDELVSIPKTMLTNFIGTLSVEKMDVVNQALSIAPGLDFLV